MTLSVDEQSRVTSLSVGLQTHQAALAAASVVKPPQPLFVRFKDGSVQTAAGKALRGPTEPPVTPPCPGCGRPMPPSKKV